MLAIYSGRLKHVVYDRLDDGKKEGFADLKILDDRVLEKNDAAIVARNSGYLDALSHMPWDGFAPSTKDLKTGALPAIWKNTADFDARFEKFGADSKAALASITDKATFMAAMPGVLNSCNGCHEKYRAKDD